MKVVKRKQTKTKLLPENELFLTLIKLRHNLAIEDLATRLGISKGLVNKIFHVWLNALYSSLAGLIMWPSFEKVGYSTDLLFHSIVQIWLHTDVLILLSLIFCFLHCTYFI